ncbi:16493_t:CDS:2, partial [Cetraspora pellucida]
SAVGILDISDILGNFGICADIPLVTVADIFVIVLADIFAVVTVSVFVAVSAIVLAVVIADMLVAVTAIVFVVATVVLVVIVVVLVVVAAVVLVVVAAVVVLVALIRYELKMKISKKLLCEKLLFTKVTQIGAKTSQILINLATFQDMRLEVGGRQEWHAVILEFMLVRIAWNEGEGATREAFTYTSSGGRDLKGTKSNSKNLRTASQLKDQELVVSNLVLKISCETKRPIHVIQGFRLDNEYASEEG